MIDVLFVIHAFFFVWLIQGFNFLDLKLSAKNSRFTLCRSARPVHLLGIKGTN